MRVFQPGNDARFLLEALGKFRAFGQLTWEGVGGARACAFSEVPYLELRGATDTANHEAPVVFDTNLKIVMKNIAWLLVQWLKG